MTPNLCQIFQSGTIWVHISERKFFDFLEKIEKLKQNEGNERHGDSNRKFKLKFFFNSFFRKKIPIENSGH